MKKTLLIIAGSALATGFLIKAAPALAQTGSYAADGYVTVVRTADLDLTTGVGQRQLDRRLTAAAAEVCEASDFDLRARNDERECREGVLADARAHARTIVAANSGAPIAIAARD